MVSYKGLKGTPEGIKEESYERAIGPDEVLVKVTHSGLCGTDAHYKDADMVLGHEGVGVVEQVGDKVTLFKKGDRAGWGYQRNSCGHCAQCLSGKEVYCPGQEKEMYGAANKDLGSMASHAVWKAAFLHAVPDGMESAHAAPLMCGGATVFTALHDYPVRPTDRVGVVGVGGLGHLAIQFAARMGCEVVVFSGTESKKDEALRLGAREFYATKDLKDYRDVCKTPVNALLVTTSAQPDWNGYFPILAPEAIVFPLGLSQGDLKVPYLPFLLKGIRVQGSVVANRQTHREMLRFAAVHKIKPIIQEFPLTVDGLNKAFDTLGNGKMKYRAVLVAQ